MQVQISLLRFACIKIWCLLLTAIVLSKGSIGQPKCKVEYYSTEHGLSHQRVTWMLQDQEGFMWFGSWDGINRFDGRSFVSYKSLPGDSSQLGNDRIDQIVEDQAGHLWLTGFDDQIYRFDKTKGQFLSLSKMVNAAEKHQVLFKRIRAAFNGFVWLESWSEGLFCIPQSAFSTGGLIKYQRNSPQEYRLPSDSFNFFHPDELGKIWIGTPYGLTCLEQSDHGSYRNKDTKLPPNLSRMNFTAVDEDSSYLYFGTDQGMLVTFNKKWKIYNSYNVSRSSLNAVCRSKIKDLVYATTSTGELVTISLQDWKTTSIKCSYSKSLHTIYEDHYGHLWIAPQGSGAVFFDPAIKQFSFFFRKNQDGIDYVGNRFRIQEDNNGLIWVIMKGGGFGYYNVNTHTVDYVLHTPDQDNYRLPGVIYNIYHDKSGILWLNTYQRELIKIILQTNDFNHQLLVEPAAPRSENEVRGILYDNKNRLWLGSKSGKLYVYQNNIKIEGLLDKEPADGFGGIYKIFQDSRGNIWIGTKRNGLYKAIPLNKEGTRYHLTHFSPGYDKPESLPANDIYAVVEDNQKRIWVGSFDHGLMLVKENGNDVRFVQNGSAFQNYPKTGFRKIRHLELDGEGNIWVGTTDGLLILQANRPDGEPYNYFTYSKKPGDPESLGNNDIQFILRDSNSQMWIATSGGGFCQAIRKNSFNSIRFRNYTTKDGMPNDYVLSIAEDNTGFLWIATENGLSKFDPAAHAFRNYDSYDGLPKASFSEASVGQRRNDGVFAFGTTKGYIAFNPAAINRNKIAGNIVLTNLQINNKDADPGMKEKIITSNINYVSGLKLKYNQNIISVDYALLDYRASNHQVFAYRLLGFDTTWHDDRQQQRATYTNLPPGDYVFEVKSLSSDLYSNNPYRSLAITILPPPWKTWWAYTLYAIAIGTILFFVRRTAIAMIRLRNKIAVEQKLAALKLNFFTNVSHELRTPLTLIVNPLEKLSAKEKLSAEGAFYVDIARKNASRMVRFINQLLDLRKVQSDKASLHIARVEIVTFVKRVGDYFVEAARNKKITLNILADQPELVAWIDIDKLDVVIYNLIANAIKFSPEGKSINIFIQSVPEEQSFSIAVADQGPGVSREKQEAIFELFYDGEKPAGKDMKGTGIGLALSREFVNLHGGKIWARNNDDGGLTVTVKLRLGFNHYLHDKISFARASKIDIATEKPVERGIPVQPAYSSLGKEQHGPVVLLVEDNEEMRGFLKSQLSEFYHVETARDGAEGLEKAIHIIPDLIISDIMMPEMDGIQLLNKIKGEVNTSHIPVILLTAKYSIESQIEGLQYGADHYITKPFNTEFLVASIDSLLRQRKKLFESFVRHAKPIGLSPTPIIITSRDETFMKEVIRVVENSMSDPGFNIELVAASMAMSRTTFYKKFKSLAGQTPIEFVRDMRLQRARQYLDAGGNNVSEVAYLVGFGNPKYFSTCFKDKFQVSPSDYLKAKTE